MAVNGIRINRPRTRHDRPWLEILPTDLRDPDLVRAKALARAQHAGTSRSNGPTGVAAMQASLIELVARQRAAELAAQRARTSLTSAVTGSANDGGAGPGAKPTWPRGAPILRGKTAPPYHPGPCTRVARHAR